MSSSSSNKNDNSGSPPPPPPPPSEPSPIQVSLLAARRTLWNGHPPSVMAWALDPLRVWALDPILSINSVLLPAVTPAPINPAIALVVDMVCVPVLSSFYWPGPADLGGGGDDKVNEAAKISLAQPTIVAVRPPSDIQSAFQGSISFVCSAIGDVVGLATNPKKFQGWVGALSQFNTFLTQSGVGGEMEEAIQKPLLGGRLLDNFKILNDIQEICHHDRIEITQHDVVPIEDLEDDIRHGHRLMRFATAAYGSEMVRSAIDADVDAAHFLDDGSSPFKSIAIHTKLDENCIKFVHAGNDHDFDQHVLHHFVAVDHDQKSVVLAIRGTLSLSGAIVDIQGMSVPFCEESGIRAQCHKGIADVAKNIWNQSGERIESILHEYPDYKFVITGHSLGAGTSCLLMMYLCVNDIIPESRQIQCYAFAPPPTFFLEESMSDNDSNRCSAKVDRAIRNTVGYIHDNDVVPFLSVASVRRLINLLDTVDNETEHIWFWKRWRMFYEYEQIPDSITNKVIDAEKKMLQEIFGDDAVCRAVDGECNMVIPARRIVWCKHKVTEGSFEAYGCDPHKVARGNIFLTPDMLSDHLPEQYEDALDNILAQYDGP